MLVIAFCFWHDMSVGPDACFLFVGLWDACCVSYAEFTAGAVLQCCGMGCWRKLPESQSSFRQPNGTGHLHNLRPHFWSKVLLQIGCKHIPRGLLCSFFVPESHVSATSACIHLACPVVRQSKNRHAGSWCYWQRSSTCGRCRWTVMHYIQCGLNHLKIQHKPVDKQTAWKRERERGGHLPKMAEHESRACCSLPKPSLECPKTKLKL